MIFPRFAFAACLLASSTLAPAAWAASSSDAAAATELNSRGVMAARNGQWEEGLDWLRQARSRNPADSEIRRNLSGVLSDWALQLARQGQIEPARAALREAAVHSPEDGGVLVRLGDLSYFQRSAFDEAVAAWKRALPLLPPEARRAITDRISQAERDRQVERAYTPVATPHFDIRATVPPPEMFGRLLEEEYARLTTQLGGGPGRITVIVYPVDDLHRLYYQRDWAIGFYDGRLRLQAREYEAGELRMLIGHELTHAFLQHLYGPAVPVWVHEGFAQLVEAGRPRSDEEQRLEHAVRDRTAWMPLEWLDRRFLQPADATDVLRAYTEARVVVEALADRGDEPLQRFLQRLGEGRSVEDAFADAFAPLTWAKANQGNLE